MLLVLRQSFPLGRFHATPWRVNPFDDRSGEWPPSPWRLVRAVVARWYQWTREASDAHDHAELDELVGALCDSSYRFHLPPHAWRGSPLRQYHPVEFGWEPASGWKGKGKDKKRVPQLRTYGTSLVQDNFWCVPSDEAGALWWFIQGDRWTPQLAVTLDPCLERLIYFGRAETLTEIRRVERPAPEPNCELLDRPISAASVRVLAPKREATREDAERVTDDAEVEGRSVPPGARLMYADLPLSPPTREEPSVAPARPECRLVQFAIGWNVAPELRAAVRLTARFRGAVIRELVRIKTGKRDATWSAAGRSLRTAIAEMAGKDADGKPVQGNRHAEFLTWWEGGVPTRVLAWRGRRPFDAAEQAAILRAASRELSWAAAGPGPDTWTVRLVPLDAAVAPPPGFDGTPAAVWESMTPYVPPRHNLRHGKPRPSESLVSQIRRELEQRGVSGAQYVEAEEIAPAMWVAVHVPRRMTRERAILAERRGYCVRLTFREPVVGPLRLGHSSSFGLGLFMPSQLRP